MPLPYYPPTNIAALYAAIQAYNRRMTALGF